MSADRPIDPPTSVEPEPSRDPHAEPVALETLVLASAGEPPTRVVDSRASDQPPRVIVAGMWRRVAAALVDLLCLAPVLAIAAWVAARAADLPLSARPDLLLELVLGGSSALYATALLLLGLCLLYAFVFLATTSSTLGLRLLRVRVINVYGDRPEWWRVLVRCFGFVVALLLFGLGLLWIGFDREKRGLHDWLAGTYVIRASNAPSA